MDSLRLPHVRAHLSEGRAAIEVHDDELRDLIDDHLVEQCNLAYDYLQPLPGTGDAWLMVFPPEVSLSDVIVALNKLEVEEVERVFRINNRRT